ARKSLNSLDPKSPRASEFPACEAVLLGLGLLTVWCSSLAIALKVTAKKTPALFEAPLKERIQPIWRGYCGAPGRRVQQLQSWVRDGTCSSANRPPSVN